MEQIPAVLMHCPVVAGRIMVLMMVQENLAIGGLPLNQKQAKDGVGILQHNIIWFTGENFRINLAFPSDV